jgi:hypothetical protein
LTKSTNTARKPLLSKIDGPNAKPVATLVKKGEVAVSRVQESFGDFLGEKVSELAKMRAQLANRPEQEEIWREFYTAVLDLRGSSALAGHRWVSSLSFSLETMLRERDPGDNRIGLVIASHMDAINLVISGRAVDDRSPMILLTELSRAVDCLALKRPQA